MKILRVSDITVYIPVWELIYSLPHLFSWVWLVLMNYIILCLLYYLQIIYYVIIYPNCSWPTVICLNFWTPENSWFSIFDKWKINYFGVSQYLSTLLHIFPDSLCLNSALSPSGHTRSSDVVLTSMRRFRGRIDVSTTSFRRHVPAGPDSLCLNSAFVW